MKATNEKLEKCKVYSLVATVTHIHFMINARSHYEKEKNIFPNPTSDVKMLMALWDLRLL